MIFLLNIPVPDKGITPAIKYLNIVIPAKAGIQVAAGCRIKSGMTELDYLVARLITAPACRRQWFIVLMPLTLMYNG